MLLGIRIRLSNHLNISVISYVHSHKAKVQSYLSTDYYIPLGVLDYFLQVPILNSKFK